MNTNFDAYASYYDLLYRDKDYLGEAEFVRDLIGGRAGDSLRILELGCGSGSHAEVFARWGNTVDGVDMSEAMISMASHRLLKLPPAIADRVRVYRGDIRTFRNGEKYDVVLSLFHVMSYQTKDEDVRKALHTARHHLKTGGTFIFDVWFGPAVLADRPKHKELKIQTDDMSVIRHTSPEMDLENEVVNVRFDVDIIKDGMSHKITEIHTMRYFFQDRLVSEMRSAGFDGIQCGAWRKDQPLSEQTWYAWFKGVAK